MKLNISCNSLIHPAAEGVSTILKHHIFNITTNDHTQIKMLAIKQALYVNWTLKELNMSASGLQSEGIYSQRE